MPIVFLYFLTSSALSDLYSLSLHDALPIFHVLIGIGGIARHLEVRFDGENPGESLQFWSLFAFAQYDQACRPAGDRKSTRLNSSHLVISYAVFCLKQNKRYDTQLYSRYVMH